MKIMVVRNILVISKSSVNITEFTLERNLACVMNVEKPLLRAQILASENPHWRKTLCV